MTSRPDQPSAPATREDKQQQRKSLTKFLSRAKTVLRRGESSKPSKDATIAEAPQKAQPATSKAQEARMRYEAMQGVSRLSKSELLEQRAKKLGERFGIDIKAADWQAADPDEMVLRTDKPIRMRVRRTCHRCNANFTTTKECPNCSHVRCTKCARYPPKRTEAEVIASRERRAAIIRANKENAPIIADYGYDYDRTFELKRPSKTGGQDLIYKKPRQRVRRTCHQCSEVFISGSKTCAGCGHTRCTDCPRDPSKKDKYPLGYPGDAFGPSSVPHYDCLGCGSLYPTGAEDGTPCRKCGREKTDQSPRALPRKIEPEPDPEVVRALEEKMKTLTVKPDA